MLDKFAGKFKEIIEYRNYQELAEILSSLRDGQYRVHICDESKGLIVVFIHSGRGGPEAVSVGDDSEPLPPPMLIELRRGYVEIFDLSERDEKLDKEILGEWSSAQGVPLEDILKEVSYLRKRGKKAERASGLESVIGDPSVTVEDDLSELLKIPSTIGKIILASRKYIFLRLGYEDAINLLKKYVTSERPRNTAIKLVSGNNAAWVTKIGGKVGIALFRDGKPVISGDLVLDKIKEVDRYIRRVVEGVGYVDIHIYIIPNSLDSI